MTRTSPKPKRPVKVRKPTGVQSLSTSGWSQVFQAIRALATH